MSSELRKSDFCIRKNKGVNQTALTIQVISNFVLCCIDSTNPLFSTSKISRPFSSSVAVQPGLFWVWSVVRNAENRFTHNAAHIWIPKNS